MTRRVLIGDSHASGLARAAERAGEPFAAWHSMPGQRTRHIAASSWLLENGTGADEVWIVSSGNDRPADDLRAPVEALLAQVPPGARVFWVGPPTAVDPRLDVDEYHRQTTVKLRDILRGTRARFIDARPFTRSGHAGDGVHFTHAGYDAWYAAMTREADLRGAPVFLPALLGAVGVLAAIGAFVWLRS